MYVQQGSVGLVGDGNTKTWMQKGTWPGASPPNMLNVRALLLIAVKAYGRPSEEEMVVPMQEASGKDFLAESRQARPAGGMAGARGPPYLVLVGVEDVRNGARHRGAHEWRRRRKVSAAGRGACAMDVMSVTSGDERWRWPNVAICR